MNRRLAQGFSPPGAWAEAVVALGANLGERSGTIDAAIAELRELPLVASVRVAPVIESVAVKPDGPDEDAPTYLNTVAIIRTRLAPAVLLAQLNRIEADHGRVRLERWGDRTLDLDLIAYGDVRSDDPRLTLPHPRAAERTFVLDPWLALDPDAVLPGRGPVSDLARALPPRSLSERSETKRIVPGDPS
ncbi:MAG TPA: 2-amino-4-hydroxy-6-hydroxymethyldihydropteridine diphosphokinase [Microbacterium sp.]|uniref:2-amino-4-hydroxy-6- hydroxymethyldihydropteridine diphosphokinase n=1 Tax=Microbacterium sp. TaxID=51671 RepID=UPI002B494311|nr:2-amino-4-hydroxy-6-hydroxymethyldihydropteridine diphosphokinase [Microbacterium sp.]HKT57801.1 2-amino-4-hydroxy-6-hydroxymethyldihydropteridine diphosphokinase [Microbacterium sp.]